MVETVLGIDGMQCAMCEAHVNEAIKKAFPAVRRVESSHRKNCTRILSEAVINEGALREALDPTGYALTSYRTAPYAPRGVIERLRALLL